jgi:MOSC domain-containing protein YiiM
MLPRHYPVLMARVLSVNVSAHARKNPDTRAPKPTGIDKVATPDAVQVRAPGPMREGLGSGLVGDTIGNQKLHGGDDQAVYAYAREDLDEWEGLLSRPLANGMFGENLTTVGIDVNEAVLGEHWRIGSAVLSPVDVRIPCNTFKAWMGRVGFDDTVWVKRFAAENRPGPYLRVLETGTLQAGDEIHVVHRPDHGVTVSTMFRAFMGEPELLALLLNVPGLAERVYDAARSSRRRV